MHPRTHELLAHIETQRANVRRAVDEIPADRRELILAEGRWSVAQVLVHLADVESRIAGMLAGGLAEARAKGLGPELDETAVGGMLDMTVLLDRSRKVVRRTGVEPNSTIPADAAWASLEASRRVSRELLEASDGLAVGEIIMPHRALGPLNFYQWILFLGGHEGRHAVQIREIGDFFRGAE